GKPEAGMGGEEAGGAHTPAQPGGPRRHHAAQPALRAGIDPGDRLPRLKRNAQRFHAIAPADRDYGAGDDRMQLEMAVAVYMIEREPRRPIGFEIPRDLSFHLPVYPRIERDLRAIKRQVVAEISFVVDQAGYFTARADRHAISENDMQPDAEVRQPPRPLEGVGGSSAADHEACRAQDAAPMGFLDGGID